MAEAPLAYSPDLRERVEDEIERLISMLDVLDGNCDDEPNGDDEPDADSEPSIGASWINGIYACDCELDTCDDEPSMGWSLSGSLGTAGMDECEPEDWG